jgi:multicomponent K+:H+ antiporter subunit E
VKRLLPHPVTTLAVAASWLLLNGTVHPSHLVLASLLGVAIPYWLRHLLPHDVRPRRLDIALRLVGRLLLDVVVSNLQVARRILGPESAIRPRFVWVPLTTRNDHATALLAAMITMTPGTLSADVSDDGGWLLVHAFDVDDEAALVEQIKSRYEAPIMQVLP